MINTGKLKDKTLFITGASRGIGKEIALKAARDGANIVVAAKTANPHPKLPGTIYTAVQEIEEAGGKGLACIVDVRDEKQVSAAVEEAVKRFGGIDIVINNASAISMTDVEDTDMKRYDLMNNINTRGTFLVSKLCLPHLKKSSHAHILNISPPLNLNPTWLSSRVAYTVAKYGMSMCVLGMHEEFKRFNIAVNALWPKTIIYTVAFQAVLHSNDMRKRARKPKIMADAAYWIFTQDSKPTGHYYIDEEVLLEAGVTNLDQYAVDIRYKDNQRLDLYVDEVCQRDKVRKVFESLERLLNTETVNKLRCLSQFNITGDGGGKWYLNLKEGVASWGQGDVGDSADTICTMDSRVFLNIFTGHLDPTTALVSGKMEISGNVKNAVEIGKLLWSKKAKL